MTRLMTCPSCDNGSDPIGDGGCYVYPKGHSVFDPEDGVWETCRECGCSGKVACDDSEEE